MVGTIGLLVLAFAIGCFADTDRDHPSSSKDLILTSAQKAAMKSRTNVENWVRFWPNGVVPYVLDDSLSNDYPAQVDNLQAAFAQYHEKTCIRFVERTTEDNYIKATSGPNFECYSYLGYTGGAQELRINESCATGNIMHELFHGLGYMHEHQRFDRDDYVKMDPSLLSDTTNYGKVPKDKLKAKSADSVYDYTSIMHYWDLGGKITTTDPDAQSVIGQREGFGKCDLSKINYLYDCKDYEILPECFSVDISKK